MRPHLDALAFQDDRPVAPLVRVPTRVIQRARDRVVTVRTGRDLARRIPCAAYLELSGDDHSPTSGDAQRVLDERAAFMAACADRSLARRDVAAALGSAAHLVAPRLRGRRIGKAPRAAPLSEALGVRPAVSTEPPMARVQDGIRSA